MRFYRITAFVFLFLCIQNHKVLAQKRPGYFGAKFFIGIEESLTPFAQSETYQLKSRGFGRIRLEKQIGKSVLFGGNWQRQVFTVKDKKSYLVTSNAYAMGFRFFGRKGSRAPVGKYFGLNLMYTSNFKQEFKNEKFADISIIAEAGRSFPFIFEKLLLNVSVSGRIRVYDTEYADPFANYSSSYDPSKYDFNEYIWVRNILKLNVGLIYGL